MLNRADSRVGITHEDVSPSSGTSPDIFVPSDRDIPRVVNEGMPIVMAKRRSERGQGASQTPGGALRARAGPAGRPIGRTARFALVKGREQRNGTPRATLDALGRLRRRSGGIPSRRSRTGSISPSSATSARSSSTSAWTRMRFASVSRSTSDAISADEQGLSRDDRERLAAEIADDILGHGPLERLLADDSVTEIMVNGPYDIWVERQGRLYETTVRFTTSRICAGSSTRSSPRSGDGSTSRRRWSTPACPTAAASTPSSRRSRSAGRSLTIRKFSEEAADLDDLIRLGTLNDRDGRVPPALRPRGAEHPHLGRNRHGQDDAPERALDRDSRRRPHRHDRGRRGASAEPAARAPARGAAEEHRGRG